MRLFAFLPLLGVCFECSDKPAQPNGQDAVVDLKALVKDGAYLVDVRTPEEFAEGHVEGSVNIPLADLKDSLELLQGKKHIVVFCRSGNRSGQAKGLLEELGYTNVVDAGTWIKVRDELEG